MYNIYFFAQHPYNNTIAYMCESYGERYKIREKSSKSLYYPFIYGKVTVMWGEKS